MVSTASAAFAYATAVTAVSDYERPFTGEETDIIEKCAASTGGDLSEYGFSLKNLWNKVSGAANRFREKAGHIWESAGRKVDEGIDWAGEAKEAVETKRLQAKDMAAMASFFNRIRIINNQYKKCVERGKPKIQEICGKENGDRRRKCERILGEKWDKENNCSKSAMSQVSTAILDVKRKAGTEKLRQGIGFLNLNTANDFGKFVNSLKSWTNDKFPEYRHLINQL